MDTLDEQLCEEVRRYPHIYNSSLKEHRDVFRCTNSWKAIAETLGKDESFCRYRWKYMRDRYVKAKRKTVGRGGEAGGNKQSSHILIKLGWLSDFVKHRETDSSVASDMRKCSSEIATLAGPPRKLLRGGTKSLRPSCHDVQTLPLGPSPGSPWPGTTSPAVSPRQQAQTLELECITFGPSVTELEQETFTGNFGPLSPSRSEISVEYSGTSPCPQCHGSRKQKELQMSLTEAVMSHLQKIDQEGGCEELSFGQYVGQALLKMGHKTRSCAKFEISQVLHKWEMKTHCSGIV